MLLEAWRKTESECADGDLTVVDSRWPRKVKMLRDFTDIANSGMFNMNIVRLWLSLNLGLSEEYVDYVFPDDEKPLGIYLFNYIYGTRMIIVLVCGLQVESKYWKMQ